MGQNTMLWTSAETALESAFSPHQASISAKKTMGLNTMLWTSAEAALESAFSPHQASISVKKTMGQNTILLITQKSWLLTFKIAPESAQKTFSSNGEHRSWSFSLSCSGPDHGSKHNMFFEQHCF